MDANAGWSGVVGLEWFARPCLMAFVVSACWGLLKMAFRSRDDGGDCLNACDVDVRTCVMREDDGVGLVAVDDVFEPMFRIN